MKRFYKLAKVETGEGGHAINLDSRPMLTPGRARLLVPTAALAEEIAAEWNAQGEEIDRHSMPLTSLANIAIDRVSPDPQAFARGLAIFGESDLLCYRAEGPESLVLRQAELWDPLLDWARQRFDVDFHVVEGIVHREQPAETCQRLASAVAANGPFALAALSPLVTISGSLIIALALADRAINVHIAWAAATLDEAWQAEHWGADAEATKALDARRREFIAADRFLGLI